VSARHFLIGDIALAPLRAGSSEGKRLLNAAAARLLRRRYLAGALALSSARASWKEGRNRMRLACWRRGLAGALALSCARARRKEGRNRMRLGFQGAADTSVFLLLTNASRQIEIGRTSEIRSRKGPGPGPTVFLIWAYQTHRNFRFFHLFLNSVNGQVIDFWIEQKKMIIRLKILIIGPIF
jgi:hypothetical protein